LRFHASFVSEVKLKSEKERKYRKGVGLGLGLGVMDTVRVRVMVRVAPFRSVLIFSHTLSAFWLYATIIPRRLAQNEYRYVPF